MSHESKNGKRVQGRALDEHVHLVGQPSDRFLGHIAPPAKDRVTISNALWEFIVGNGYDGDFEAVGGDSTATNTGHKDGIIHLLELKTQR